MINRRTQTGVEKWIGAATALLLLCNMTFALENSKADFFVSPDGNDLASGTQEKPFATLSRARDAVREVLAKDADRDITVQIHGGIYRLQKTIVFTLSDSAPKGRTVTYAAAPGEKPIFSAGVSVTGWQRENESLWSAPLPEGLKSIKVLFDEKEGARLPRARGPGFKPTTKGKSWHSDDHYRIRYPNGAIQQWPTWRDAELLIIPGAPWSMNVLPLASIDEEKLEARAATRGTYSLDQPRFGRYSATAWIENVPAFINEPGEWAVDLQKRRIFLQPRGQEPGSDIVAPALTELIRIEGDIDYDGPQDKPVRGIVLKGLTFTHADRYTWSDERIGWGVQHDWELFDRPTAMVRLRGAEDCRIEDCTFTNSGASGIRLDLHCQKNRIIENTLSQLGGVGILLAGYGPGTKDVNRGNEVLDNHIHDIGLDYWASPGIFVWQSGENRVAHNLIHHTGYSGIVVSGRINFDPNGIRECSRTVRSSEIERAAGPLTGDEPWKTREPFLHARKNIVEYNEIHSVMQLLGDGNAIYISGCGDANQIRYNLIRDITSSRMNAAIRCDDDQHGTLIHGNIITNCSGEGFIIKGANTITNNIIYNLKTTSADGSPIFHRRGHLVLPASDCTGSIIQRNIFHTSDPDIKLLTESPKNKDGSALLRQTNTDKNLYFHTAKPDWGQAHIASQRKYNIERQSVTEDPLFVDPAKGDFNMHPDSPALKLGFEPIDFKRIGLRKDSDLAANRAD